MRIGQQSKSVPSLCFLASELSKGVTGKVFGVQGQRLHVYEVHTNDGVEKEGSDLWTAQEIADQLKDIMAFEEATAPAADGDQITAAFSHFQTGFALQPPRWMEGKHPMGSEGGTPQTIIVEGEQCTVKPGLEGTPTCTVKMPADVLLALLTGEMDAQKVFMTGKATADNMGDLMKMAMAFDFEAVAAALAASGDTDVVSIFSHFLLGSMPAQPQAGKETCIGL